MKFGPLWWQLLKGCILALPVDEYFISDSSYEPSGQAWIVTPSVFPGDTWNFKAC